MKKLVTIMLVVSLFTLGGCGKKEKTDEAIAEESTSTEEFSIPEIEESSEELEVEEESPVDFDFMNGEEVNAEAIVAHAHELGVLENIWNNATEIKADDIINAYEEKNREKYESFAQDDQEYIVQIPEEDMDSVVTIFVDVPTDTLHQAEKYNETSKSYEFKYNIEVTEETELEWPVQVSEVVTLREDVYEIVLVDATDEAAPVAFGTLTVENNENVPKYLSFIKPESTAINSTPTEDYTNGTSSGTEGTGGTSASEITTKDTIASGSTGEGTTSGAGKGSSGTSGDAGWDSMFNGETADPVGAIDASGWGWEA